MGKWVEKRSHYEDELTQLLSMRRETGERYWEAIWNGFFLEFKKGAIRLDVVRYSEIFLGKEDYSSSGKESLCLFLRPDKERIRIKEIICVRTQDLFPLMNLTKETAEFFVKYRKSLHKEFNGILCLGETDVRSVQSFSIT